MPYQSTPGLPSDVIFEIVARVHDVAQGRGIDFRRHMIGLYKQVLITGLVAPEHAPDADR